MAILGFNPFKKKDKNAKGGNAKAAEKKAMKTKLAAKKAAGGCEFC